MAYQAIFRKENGTLPYSVASDGTAIAAGQVVVVASAVAGVSPEGIAKGATGTLQRKGVFEVACAATHAAYALGTVLYWDDTNKVATATSTSNAYLGTVHAAAAENSPTVYVDVDADLSALFTLSQAAFAAHA